MAIFKDSKNFTIKLTEKDTDWYSLLQFCVCKVNPKYYKNIHIKFYKNEYRLYWESLNGNHLWFYPFPKNTTEKTINTLSEYLPKYIKIQNKK